MTNVIIGISIILMLSMCSKCKDDDNNSVTPVGKIEWFEGSTLINSDIDLGVISGNLSKTYTLKNVGNGDVNISSLISSSSDFNISNNTCIVVLPPNQNCNFDVIFNATGKVDGTLYQTNVEINGSLLVKNIKLIYNEPPLVLSYYENSVLLGSNFDLGVVSSENLTVKTIVLQNDGLGPTPILTINLNNSNISISNDSCSGNYLNSGSFCNFDISFNPQGKNDIEYETEIDTLGKILNIELKLQTYLSLDLFSGESFGIANSGVASISLVPFKDEIYFVGNDGTNGQELWKTNGESVSLVSDINPGSGNGYTPNTASFTITKDYLYFRGNTTASGRDLYRTDGTTTSIAHNFTNSANDFLAREVFDFNNNQLLVSGNNGSGPTLFNYNGTTANLVTGVFSASNNDPRLLTKIGSEFLFLARNGTSNYELWRTNGLNSGSKIVAGQTFTATGNLNNLKIDKIDGSQKLVFIGSKVFLIKTDSVSSKSLIAEIDISLDTLNFINGPFATVQAVTTLGDILLFTAIEDGGSETIWKYDPDIVQSTGINSSRYCADDSDNPCKLENIEVSVPASSIKPEFFQNSQNLVYFQASDQSLWRTDGSPSGTIKISSDSLLKIDSFAQGNVPAINGDDLYFIGMDVLNAHKLALYKTDGTLSGTIKINSFNGYTLLKDDVDFDGIEDNYFSNYKLRYLNNKLYMILQEASLGFELWVHQLL